MSSVKYPEKSLEDICPFLGSKGDRNIAFTIVTKEHYCHKVKKASPINIEHQSAFCITNSHVDCVVYREKKISRLPINIQGTQSSAASMLRWPQILVFAAGLVGLAFLANYLLFGQQASNPLTAQSEDPIQTSNDRLAIELTVTQIAFEIDQITPSKTVTPSIQPHLFETRRLRMPLCHQLLLCTLHILTD